MEKHEKYGILITVSSLLLVIVYSSEAYDEWDLMVSFIAAYFGISFLINKMSVDWFSSFNASFITVMSVTTGIITINKVWNLSDPFHKLVMEHNFGLSNHFLAVLIFSVLLSLCFKPNNA